MFVVWFVLVGCLIGRLIGWLCFSLFGCCFFSMCLVVSGYLGCLDGCLLVGRLVRCWFVLLVVWLLTDCLVDNLPVGLIVSCCLLLACLLF